VLAISSTRTHMSVPLPFVLCALLSYSLACWILIDGYRLTTGKPWNLRWSNIPWRLSLTDPLQGAGILVLEDVARLSPKSALVLFNWRMQSVGMDWPASLDIVAWWAYEIPISKYSWIAASTSKLQIRTVRDPIVKYSSMANKRQFALTWYTDPIP
jgi:hypothetical protein